MSELLNLIESMDWEVFQEPNDGRVYLHYEGQVVRLSYRIGLHMRKPMEAVMTKGDYFKLRAAPQFDTFQLERLDPENVDKCLYTFNQNWGTPTQHADNLNWAKSWHPKNLKGAGLTQDMLQGLMQQQQLAQTNALQQNQLKNLRSLYQQAMQDQRYTSFNDQISGLYHAGGLGGIGIGLAPLKGPLNPFGGGSGVSCLSG